ncbi:MAG: DUF1214 domain-containing protein [Mycobacterium sp.]
MRRPVHPVRVLVTLVATLGLLAVSGCGGVRNSEAADDVRVLPDAASSPIDTLREKAKDAYLFAFPLVLNYRAMYRQAIAGDREFGRWLHMGESTPQDTDIVTPNNDTPYSFAWVDLRSQPWVLTVPPIEAGRYHASQWDDLWGFVLGSPGGLEDGNDGVSVMLAAPDDTAAPPPGVSRVIKGESSFLGTMTRTQKLSTDDGMAQVRAIQDNYRLESLSSFLGTAAPDPAPAIEWPEWIEGAETTTKFWDYVALLLPHTTNNSADSAMLDVLAELGITRDAPFNSAGSSREVQEALQTGVADGQAELKRLSEAGDLNSAILFGHPATMGNNYVDRALGAYLGLFGNVAEQAVYYSLPTDSDGQALDGSKAGYTLTFPPGGQPPVKYFWSLTMYDIPQRRLVSNPINRYSLGSDTPELRQNPDGSTTIYLSAHDPGGEQSGNWLPAPAGPFWVVLRTYGPKEAILQKLWQPPPIDKQP